LDEQEKKYNIDEHGEGHDSALKVLHTEEYAMVEFTESNMIDIRESKPENNETQKSTQQACNHTYPDVIKFSLAHNFQC
jgi:hypothetical protein